MSPYWLIVWTVIIGLIVKLSGRTKQKRDLIIGSGLIVLSALPSQYYGWTEIAYPVMYWGEGLTLVGQLLWWRTPKLKRDKTIQDETTVRPANRADRLGSNFKVLDTTEPKATN